MSVTPGPDEPTDQPPGRSAGSGTPRLSAERRNAFATVGGVVAIVLVIVVANLAGKLGNANTPTPGVAPVPASADRTTAAELAGMTPEEIAAEALSDRGQIADQKVLPGTAKFRERVQKFAGDQPYSFTMTSFNILGSQHTAPGGAAAEYAPGRVRTEWAAGLMASYGATIVGLQELQADQLDALGRATAGQFDFWPGAALGGKGIPQSLMWKSSVWTPTYQDSITVPFMGSTRPQPIVRLQHIETGREIYVLNIHNSPKDRQGREGERDKAMAIEIAAIKQLRQEDGIPVFIMGDFNEHEEAFCKFTGLAGMIAANGGSNTGGTCRPPRPMRVDWIFGTPEVGFSGFLLDTSPAARRITDHAVLTSAVSVQ